MPLNEYEIAVNKARDVKYITPDKEETTFNLTFKLAPDSIDELITASTTIMAGEQILKVKKPDYLGESMWELKHGKDTIQASIIDKEWLQEFQSGKVALFPGDSIRAIVKQEYRYDHENNLVSERQSIEKVISVIHQPENPDMFNSGEPSA